MTPQESTVANADLWTKYFQDEWSRWLDPFNLRAADTVTPVAEGTGARVAGFLSLVAAGPIAWLYSSNNAQAGARARDDANTNEQPLMLPHEGGIDEMGELAGIAEGAAA